MKKRVVVLGAAESGVGVAILAKQNGYEVFVSDYGVVKKRYKEVLLNNKIDWEERKHTQSKILNAEEVVKSPGIPSSASIVQEIEEAGIPVISEIEFTSRYTDAKLIGVTGSNGKTTVVNWISFILENAGFSYVKAGNIGVSFAKAVATHSPDYFVLEISSFQLDDIVNFHPHITVLTNITPDHLDRYNEDFQQYIDAKFRITENQTKKDFFIYDKDDKIIRKEIKNRNIKAKQIPFSFHEINGEGTNIMKDKLTSILEERSFSAPAKDISLKGEHNAKNAMAAATVANLLSIRKQTIRKSLAKFHGVEHRLEPVLKVRNVQYINDSKATNINSTYYALQTIKPKIVWIAGGEDKGNNYAELLPLINKKVKAIICLGADNTKLINSFNNCVDVIVDTDNMTDAVSMAYEVAEPGDTVLLSPACASFDLFENFEDRGNQFKEAIRNL